MYRTVARRMLKEATTARGGGRNDCIRVIYRQSPFTNASSLFCTSVNGNNRQSPPPAKNPNLNQNQIPRANLEFPNQSDSTTSSSSSSAASYSSSSSTFEETGRGRPRQRGVEYQEEQGRVLQASLRHVLKLGWGEEAMIAGARDAGVSPSIVGSFPRKDAALVEYFMDECLQKLIDRIDSGEDLQNLVPSERISKIVRIRLEMQAPYISKWPQALSIQAHPANVPTSFKQRAMLVDEISHAAGDQSSDIDWYVKRTVLGGIYSTTEIYMLTDTSPDFRDTWAFLDDRVKDAFDLKKTIQEATYLAEAVGAGMGNSFQGFVKKVFQR